MFTPSRRRENERLHKLTHDALQVVMHTAWVFIEHPQNSQIWHSGTSPNQGIPNQVPWLGLLSLFQIWEFCRYSLNTLKYPKVGTWYFFLCKDTIKEPVVDFNKSRILQAVSAFGEPSWMSCSSGFLYARRSKYVRNSFSSHSAYV